MAAEVKTPSQYFDRDTKLYLIREPGIEPYLRYMYVSTGEGNKRFNNKYKGLYVPTYGHVDSSEETIKKSQQQKEVIYKGLPYSPWQLELLTSLWVARIPSEEFRIIDKYLALYNITKGELFISKNLGGEFWRNLSYEAVRIIDERLTGIEMEEVERKIFDDTDKIDYVDAKYMWDESIPEEYSTRISMIRYVATKLSSLERAEYFEQKKNKRSSSNKSVKRMRIEGEGKRKRKTKRKRKIKRKRKTKKDKISRYI